MAGTAKTRGDAGAVALLDAPVPPHSVEAEQAVLGGLLLDAAAWDNVADAVTREDFYRADHKLIFEAIAALAGEAKPCDVVTVSQQLERQRPARGRRRPGVPELHRPRYAECRQRARVRGHRARALAAAAADPRRQ